VVTASAAEAKYNNNSCVNKNPVRCDGSLRNCYSEKGNFTETLILKRGTSLPN
jgi:hypothetical protein